MSSKTDDPSCPKPVKKAPPPPPPRKRILASPTSPSVVASPPRAVHSEYLMNDIPRGTKEIKLINCLLAPGLTQGPLPVTHAHVQFAINIVDSRLDDELSVATIKFSDTPQWLQQLNQDQFGFPKITALGTLWRSVDRAATDDEGRTEFIRGVRTGKKGTNFLYTEMLAEFPDTDVNVQDATGRTALHWACAGTPPEMDMVMLCLQVPNCDIGLKDGDGLTAFDLAIRSGDERIQALFYHSMLELEQSDPQAALLRILTVTSVKTEKPVFPGEALFEPVTESNTPLVRALLDRGVELSTRNENGDTALHLAVAKPDNVEITSLLLDAGCDVNAVGKGAATPLHYAVRIAGNRQMVQLLLDHHADVGAKDDDGRSAVQLAEDSQYEELVLLFKVLKRVEYEPDAVAEHREAIAPFPEQPAGHDDEQHSTPRRLTIDLDLEPEMPEQAVAVVTQPEAVVDFNRTVEPFVGDIDEQDKASYTALHRVVKNGDHEAVRLLILQGANIEGGDDFSNTALHLAARNGDTETVKVLLAAGANVEAATIHEQTPLYLAARNSNQGVVNALLAAGANVDAMDNTDDTALHHAVGSRHTEVVNALLAAGANSNAVNKFRDTVLHFASKHEHPGIVNLLLEAGADIDAVNQFQQSALHLAVGIGFPEVVDALLAAGANIEAVNKAQETALHCAVKYPNLGTVNQLLAAGAAIDAVNESQDTVLHSAVARGYTEGVNALLAAGANIEAVNKSQKTALHSAVARGYTEGVNALLAAGANVEAVDESQQTVLHCAVALGCWEAVGAKTDEGTVLYQAAPARHIKIVQALLDAGASTQARARANETALHSAARYGHISVVQALLSAGARIHTRGKNGTAYQIALGRGHTDVCELLQAHGAGTTSVGRFSYALVDQLVPTSRKQ